MQWSECIKKELWFPPETIRQWNGVASAFIPGNINIKLCGSCYSPLGDSYDDRSGVAFLTAVPGSAVTRAG